MTRAPRFTRRELLAGAAILTASAPCTFAASTEDERLQRFFEDVFRQNLARNPMLQTELGIKTAQDQWNDISEGRRLEDAQIARRNLATLRRFDFETLNAANQLSYRLFEYQTEIGLEQFEWRHHRYPLSQMRGLQRTIPHTLINDHSIDSREDAEAYIARLHGVKRLLAQQIDNLTLARRQGIQPPRFVYPMVIGTCENLLRGAPFDAAGTDSPILADFKAKVAGANLSAGVRSRLADRAAQALREGFGAGFLGLIEYLRAAQRSATDEAGVWKLPDGRAFYTAMLRSQTTLPLSAYEVHETGLREVARIHGEMREVMRQVGFKGSLRELFHFVRTDPQFYLPNTEEGRTRYLQGAEAVLDEINGHLPKLMSHVPKARMIIKRVEPWLETSAGTAGYFGASADGTRPGILYFNLRNMANLPKYEMSAITYHEGVPGHHLEISISQELTGLPRFRRYSGYTAYSEGWALYAEELPRPLGLYKDAWQDFGRLSMELMRAGRLVVDSGLHALKWTREEAIAWLDQNAPNSHEDNVGAVGRYIVIPAQATAYMTGKLKLLELRDRAQRMLGQRFDVRRFHDAVLGNGPVPLQILDDSVTGWIRSAAG